MKESILKFLVILITVFVLGPIFSFLHELGHIVIPFLNGDKVKVVMGIETFNIFRLNLGTLEIVWNNTFLPWVGYAKFNGPNSLACLLGPITSFSLFAFFKFFLMKKIKGEFLQRVTYSSSYWCLYQGIFTIIPMKYPDWLKGYEGFTSDGMKFVQLVFLNN